MSGRSYITKANLLILASIFIGYWSTVADDLQSNILSFPEIAACNYRPDVAVASANALISAGEENAYAALEKATKENTAVNNNFRQINQNVCLLCRLLFTSTNPNQPLRPPMIGDPLLSGYEFKISDWPDLPFIIVDNMPLSISSGYAGGGLAERGQDYLAYCKANGIFRTQLFAKPSSVAISNALDRVSHSSRWTSIPWSSFGKTTLTNLDWEQSSNVVENVVLNDLRQQAANMVKNEN